MEKIEEIIRSYLNKKGLKLSTFARAHKLNEQSFYGWFGGKTKISAKMAEKLERLTNKELRYEELTDKPRRKKPLRGKQLSLIE